VKVDREKQLVCLEEELQDIDVEDLREALPSHQPRFLVYSYRLDHDDGRTSYPMCFIFSTPRGNLVNQDKIEQRCKHLLINQTASLSFK